MTSRKFFNILNSVNFLGGYLNIIENILRQLYKSVACPVCKRKYQYGEIKLRGELNNNFILEAACSNNHEPTITLIVVKYDIKSPRTNSPMVNSISLKDKYQLRIFLNNFNGDFKSLFNGRIQ